MKICISLVMDESKMNEVAGKIRYDDLLEVALRIMKLDDEELSDIGAVNEQTINNKKYAIIRLWADTARVATKEALHKIFSEARANGLPVPQKVMDCLISGK